MNWLTPEIYCDVFDRLERDEVRYVVVSSMAVVLHGHVRPVADLDMVIEAAPEAARHAMHALALAGFVPSIPLPLSALTVLRMFDAAQREIDVFVRYSIPFDELWAGSELVRVGGSTARVASLDHLLRAKRLHGRPHDLGQAANAPLVTTAPWPTTPAVKPANFPGATVEEIFGRGAGAVHCPPAGAISP